MCGLVGYVGPYSIKIKDMFEFMLLVDQVRGFHSTGVATIANGDVSIIKKAMHSTDFLDLKPVSKLLNSHGYTAIIGHNRAATRGSIINQNAHPFEIGDITLAHNGTLTNQMLLPDSKRFEVDSENIAHAINKEGIDATLGKLEGAFALSWYDYKHDTVSLIRNDERPLSYTYSEDGKSIYWASEPWMIYVGAARADIKIQAVQSLPVGKLLTVDMNLYRPLKDKVWDFVSLEDKKLLKKPVGQSGGNIGQNKKWWVEARVYDAKTGRWVYTGYDTQGGLCQLDSYVQYNLGDCLQGVPIKTTIFDGARTYKFEPKSTYRVKYEDQQDKKKSLVWFDGKIESEEFVESVLNKGCAWCSSPTEFDEAIPISKDEYVCVHCSHDEECKQYIN